MLLVVALRQIIPSTSFGGSSEDGCCKPRSLVSSAKSQVLQDSLVYPGFSSGPSAEPDNVLSILVFIGYLQQAR